MEGLQLSVSDREAIAERVAEKLWERMSGAQTAPGAIRLVDARQLADELGVSPAFVRANAESLGGHRLPSKGKGKKARWRFDVEQARQSLSTTKVSTSALPPQAAPRKRAPKSNGARLLPVHNPEGDN